MVFPTEHEEAVALLSRLKKQDHTNRNHIPREEILSTHNLLKGLFPDGQGCLQDLCRELKAQVIAHFRFFFTDEQMVSDFHMVDVHGDYPACFLQLGDVEFKGRGLHLICNSRYCKCTRKDWQNVVQCAGCSNCVSEKCGGERSGLPLCGWCWVEKESLSKPTTIDIDKGFEASKSLVPLNCTICNGPLDINVKTQYPGVDRLRSDDPARLQIREHCDSENHIIPFEVFSRLDVVSDNHVVSAITSGDEVRCARMCAVLLFTHRVVRCDVRPELDRLHYLDSSTRLLRAWGVIHRACSHGAITKLGLLLRCIGKRFDGIHEMEKHHTFKESKEKAVRIMINANKNITLVLINQRWKLDNKETLEEKCIEVFERHYACPNLQAANIARVFAGRLWNIYNYIPMNVVTSHVPEE